MSDCFSEPDGYSCSQGGWSEEDAVEENVAIDDAIDDATHAIANALKDAGFDVPTAGHYDWLAALNDAITPIIKAAVTAKGDDA
jgi:hypothetical protein